MRLLLISLALFSTLLFSTNAYAQLAGDGIGVGPGTGFDANEPIPSEGCDFTAIKDSLHGTETAGADNLKACSTPVGGGSDTQALGKYQFIPATWNNLMNKPGMEERCHAHELGCTHQNMGNMTTHPQCCAVQECFMDSLLAENLDRARKNQDCKDLIGKPVYGCWGGECGTCNMTWSGILAGMHLGGPDACSGVLNNGVGDEDDFGTSEADYMWKHCNLPVPGECEPLPYDPSVPPPTATKPQLDFLNNTGDSGYINTGAATIKGWWVGGLMLMAEQFTANMMAQVEAIGEMLDAKHQLETQRLMQQKVAEAHKDYQPSEQMCTFGTFARDLASTERNANLTREALSKDVLQRELGSGDSKGATREVDKLSRLLQFRKTFCEPGDSNNGLKYLCPEPGDADMRNRDIDYTRTLDEPLSLDINMIDPELTPDEEAVFALIDNLFAHQPMPRIGESPLEQKKFQYYYHNMRSIIAMRGIARNSFANLIALKTAAPENATPGGPYLKALMKELGLNEEEVEEILGENPSYYAQMEFLSRKIYQNPSFYTNLYDKPANVERIRAAMRAIKLMNDRDIQASMHRREMLLSMILELRLREQADTVYNATEKALFGEE